MGNMKFNVGDRVRIKSLNWYNQMLSIPSKIVGKNDFVAIECGAHIFTKEMCKFCGRVMTIKDIGIDFYLMDEDVLGYEFTDEMIECKMEEECPQDFIEKYCKSCKELNNFICFNEKGALNLGKTYEIGHAFFLKIRFVSSVLNKVSKEKIFDTYISGTIKEYIKQVKDENQIDTTLEMAREIFIN
jgi:hypothetical protein